MAGLLNTQQTKKLQKCISTFFLQNSERTETYFQGVIEYCPASSTQETELHHVMITTTKAIPSSHTLNQSFFLRKFEVQQHRSP